MERYSIDLYVAFQRFIEQYKNLDIDLIFNYKNKLYKNKKEILSQKKY